MSVARDRRLASSARSRVSEMTEKILTHEQVLEILSQQAKDGSVTAAAALERALQARERV